MEQPNLTRMRSESVMFESDLLPTKFFQVFFPIFPYIVKRVLAKEAYTLMDYDKIPLAQPPNGFYLKHYYA